MTDIVCALRRKESTMTTREFYQAVADSDVGDELIAKAQELIAALDAKNAKRKTTPTKDQKEAAARREIVLGFFADHPTELFTRDAVADALGISPAQVTAACKALADSLTKSEAKFEKSRKVVYQYKG
jgi:hypothetical protein